MQAEIGVRTANFAVLIHRGIKASSSSAAAYLPGKLSTAK